MGPSEIPPTPSAEDPETSSRYRIGIDLGGTKIEAVLLTPEGRLELRERVATPRGTEDDYRAILAAVVNLATSVLERVPASGRLSPIGTGIPGSIDTHTGRVDNANTTSLNGRPFQTDIEARLGRPVGMENDANCFTAAESRMGAGRGHAIVFGIIMGTGVGGGLTVDGRVHHGRHGIAGEWGHLSVAPEGRLCWCGNRGCVETLISGPGLTAAYEARFGEKPSVEAIVEGYRRGDTPCRTIFEQFLEDFGRCLGGLISILDPDAVVLGGGLSNIDELYTEGAARVRRYAFHPDLQTPILKHRLGDSAGVFGAAWIGR
ncbi:MAG: ROK family protein [Desulfosarcina sp.]|nr:ROK family protein [Desulfobacterales bacterium]